MKFQPTRQVQPGLFDHNSAVPRNGQLGDVPFPRPVLYDPDLLPSHKIVFCTLLDFRQPGKHWANISIRKLAAYLGLSKETIEKSTDHLYQRGYILSVVQCQGKFGEWHNVYSLRTFPYPAEQPRKSRTKRNPIQKKPRLYPQVDQPKLFSEQNGQQVLCAVCNGMGFKTIERDGTTGVVPCQCKNPNKKPS